MSAHDVLKQWYQGQPLVWGHRGAKAYAPMNTLPSFELAMTQGAHGIELDVHRSKDGHAVILHDYTVDGTTNGQGVITEMTLAQIKELDAGAWFGEAYRGTSIPTLDEVFELVGQRMIVNVEIKGEHVETDGVEQVVADCIQRHNMLSRVLLSSFNPTILKRFRQIMPQIPLGYLQEASYTPPGYGTAAAILREDCEAWHPSQRMVTETYMQHARSLGRIVNVWTSNDAQRVKEMRDLGVNAFITDTPDVILKALQE